VTLPPGGLAGESVDRLSEELALWQRLLATGGASNAWAVAARRSATGRPILASDPHLAPMLPNLWYLASLHCPQFHVVGRPSSACRQWGPDTTASGRGA